MGAAGETGQLQSDAFPEKWLRIMPGRERFGPDLGHKFIAHGSGTGGYDGEYAGQLPIHAGAGDPMGGGCQNADLVYAGPCSPDSAQCSFS